MMPNAENHSSLVPLIFERDSRWQRYRWTGRLYQQHCSSEIE